MRRWWLGGVLLWSLGGTVFAAGPVQLSEQEQRWIQQHPVLRVGVVEDLIPFEYMRDGTLQGRSAHYLQLVTDATGLEFTYVPGKTIEIREQMLLDGQVDLLSSYLRFRSEPATKGLALLTYQTTSPIIVTRFEDPDIFDLDQLHGKTVMVPDVDHYEEIVGASGIEVTLIKSKSALEMLTRVRDGSADAVVATEIFLMPYLYRQFQGILEASGVVGSQMLDVSMAVRSDQALLHSILEKVLGSITAEQRNEMYEHWYHDLGLDVPTLVAVSSHYWHVLIMGALLLASLCVLVYRGHLRWRQAVRNEQEKTMFLAVMGHEIRSPMNAVLAAMELLGHTRLNEQQRHFVHLANGGANALVRLLDNVLDTPGSGARALRLSIEPTDVTALVQGVVGLHRLRAREKHLSLNVSIHTALPLLLLDSSRLTQILHNLLSNAIKFTDVGGVDIKLYLLALPAGGQQLQVKVRDTGIGISEAVQASLFRPYAQASQSYKRSGGTGLGLVICQQLANLMQGSLTLSSEPGVGTTFILCVPVTVAPQTAEPPQVQQSAPEAETDGLQILVVEDTLANQEVLRAQIGGFGCEAVIAADAAQAHSLFVQQAYQLILMDCDLPDQDGYSLVRELREFERGLGRPRCPIIAISALTGEQHLKRCMDAGMDAALSKPIRLGQLREVIERWCDVTLAAPRASLMAPQLDQAAINREMASDLGSLIKAIALCDRPSAVHVAHRLHGAALIMEWLALGQSAEYLERLLRAQEGWDSPAYAQALRALVEHWRALGGDAPLEVLPPARASRVTQR